MLEVNFRNWHWSKDNVQRSKKRTEILNTLDLTWSLNCSRSGKQRTQFWIKVNISSHPSFTFFKILALTALRLRHWFTKLPVLTLIPVFTGKTTSLHDKLLHIIYKCTWASSTQNYSWIKILIESLKKFIMTLHSPLWSNILNWCVRIESIAIYEITGNQEPSSTSKPQQNTI